MTGTKKQPGVIRLREKGEDRRPGKGPRRRDDCGADGGGSPDRGGIRGRYGRADDPAQRGTPRYPPAGCRRGRRETPGGRDRAGEHRAHAPVGRRLQGHRLQARVLRHPGARPGDRGAIRGVRPPPETEDLPLWVPEQLRTGSAQRHRDSGETIPPLCR